MSYDIIIIGAGPGGYVMAERAGRLGKQVLLLEQENLGGVCLNRGCIPTKTLLNSAKHFVHAQEAAGFGVSTGEVGFDLPRAMARKNDVVKTLRAGVGYKMKKNKVKVAKGKAVLLGSRQVQVGDTVGADLPHVLTSDEILEIEELPDSLVVIGGGVIGIEFASFFSSLGVKVEVVEMLKEIIPFMDRAQAAEFRKALRGKIGFHLGCRVTGIDEKEVKFEDASGEVQTLEAGIVLMAAGRVPNVEGMGFAEAGLDFDRTGIRTDEQQRTNLPNVYAIGDVTGRSQLAHSASRMGEVALSTIVGKRDRFRSNAVPWVVYSLPEIVGCGLTEDEAHAAGYAADSVSLPMIMSGRFVAENGKRAPGSVKVVRDTKTDVVLGVHMFGGICSEIIWGVAEMIEAELRVQDVQEVIFPHPTVSEVVRDAMFEFS
jgi:dihydrolipoamide dehydrogenase